MERPFLPRQIGSIERLQFSRTTYLGHLMRLLAALALALAASAHGAGASERADSAGSSNAISSPSDAAPPGGPWAALGPAPAAAQAPPAGPSAAAGPGAPRTKDVAGEDRPPILGLTLDGGFPDGVALSALYRPVRLLRLDAGVTYNLIGFGLRGGATFVPFRSTVAPVLRAEYGHTFDGDATGFVGHFTTLTPAEQIVLRRVGYDYASVQLGLEIGASDRLVFFARGGVAWFWTTVQNFQEAAQTANPSVSSASNPNVRGTVPTATLGALFYFW